jgi:hypothetical protein
MKYGVWVFPLVAYGVKKNVKRGGFFPKYCDSRESAEGEKHPKLTSIGKLSGLSRSTLPY